VPVPAEGKDNRGQSEKRIVTLGTLGERGCDIPGAKEKKRCQKDARDQGKGFLLLEKKPPLYRAAKNAGGGGKATFSSERIGHFRRSKKSDDFDGKEEGKPGRSPDSLSP